MLEIVILIMIFVLPLVLNWLLRKRIGRYLSYTLANLVSAIFIGACIYYFSITITGMEKSRAILIVLPLQLALLVWGLIWLHINAFKFTEPRPPLARIPTASLSAGSVEPVLEAPVASPADPHAGASNGRFTENRTGGAYTDTDPADEASRNFFVRYWRGQYSLAFSYWIVGFLGGIAILLVILGIRILFTASRSSDYNPYGAFVFILFSWAFLIAWTIWDIVGLWRSATRSMHRRWRQGKHTFWGGLVKLFLVAAILGGFRTLVENTGPQIYEAYNIAFNGDPNVLDYTLRIMRNGTEMEITGGFKYGLSDDVERLLKTSPQIKVVHLHSTGGRIGEAMKLHDIIQQHQLVTYVANECDSACTIAFAGGKQRWLGPAGKLGFHAPSFPGMERDDLGAAVAEQQAIFVRDGFAPDFVARALSTPATSLWTPTASELLQGRAITNVAHIGMFAMSGFGAEFTPATAGPILRAMFPMIEPLEARDPDTVGIVTQQFYQMYLGGSTAVEFTASLRERLAPALEKYRSLADDETQLLFVKLTADKYRYLAKMNVQTCYEYISGTDTSPILPREFGRRERDLEARMIVTAAPRPPGPQDALKQAWTDISRLLEAGPQAKDMHLFSTPPQPDQYADYCRLYAALNEAILQLPPERGAMVARDMLSER